MLRSFVLHSEIIWTAALLFSSIGMTLLADEPGPDHARTEEQASIGLPLNPQRNLGTDHAKLVTEPYETGTQQAGGAVGGGRTKVRQLFSFEDNTGHTGDGQPIPYMMKEVDDLEIVWVKDNGVTDGEWCARMTVPAGVDYGNLILRGDAIKDWADYDYFALDVYVDDDHPYRMVVELWDIKSVNYATRRTYEAEFVRRGAQTLLYPINRAGRNGKMDGLSWEELSEADKIDLNNLKFVKIFTTPRKDRPATFWIDNIRLMQEDAAKPKLHVPVPSCAARAFQFGNAGSGLPGFSTVTPETAFTPETGFGFTATGGLTEKSTGWPDLLAGTHVSAGRDKTMTFQTSLPNGEYRVWLCAGPIIPSAWTGADYLLKLNDRTLEADKPDFTRYDGEEYLYRFLWTQYSERPHAAWLDYIDRMYPTRVERVTVADGALTLTARDFFLSAMIVVPAGHDADVARMAAKIRQARLEAFEAALIPATAKKPVPQPGDDAYVLYVPESWRAVSVNTAPTAEERQRVRVSAAGAPGQNVFMRVAVTPFKDLGSCKLDVSDLTGEAGTIPGSLIRGHFKNYRWQPRGVTEMVLLPSLALRVEKGVSQCFWLWLTLPADAKPGRYTGTFTFKTGTGATTSMPVDLTVHAFRLEEVLPVSFGMFYGGRQHPRPPEDIYWDVIRDQMTWMRRIGFTSVQKLDATHVTGVHTGQGTASLRMDATSVKLAKEVGFFRHPAQRTFEYTLGIGRAIGRRLIDSGGGPISPVESDPGCELKHPKFKACYIDAMRKYKAFMDSLDVPYMVWFVDEPREVPNPWNRNRADTITYAEYLKEAGFTNRYLTPMGDTQSGLDYTDLVDHTDIMCPHAAPSCARFIALTKQKGKPLQFYNSGMSRLVWGFYQWAQRSTGYTQWHWCAPFGNSMGGYPGSEWYNPFTAMAAMAPNAPSATYHGGFLYCSAYLTAAEGITDYAYVYSLQRALDRHEKAGTKAAVVLEGKALLAEIKAASPDFPNGQAAQAAARQLDSWRARIADVLTKLP